MEDLIYDLDDLIVALATPWGEGALGIIRTSGNGCIEVLAEMFSRPKELSNAEGHRMVYGKLLSEKGGEAVDEVVLGVYRNPKSYTGQDMVEISCHGSLPGLNGILQSLRNAGFRDAGPGEFTLRAFLNRKMDLTRAEAVNEIVTSKSRRAHTLALHRLSGSIEERINTAKETLTRFMSSLAIQLDYPEDEEDSGIPMETESLYAAKNMLEELLQTYRIGRIFQEGVRVALAGRTNSGKSSLFNLFLKEDRSIVSDIHGTTRDYIESWVTIRGIPVSLYDTAGFRESEHPVEVEGIRRSGQIIQTAQLVLYLVDSCEGLVDEDREYLKNHNCIGIWNKIDLEGSAPAPEGFIPVSVLSGQGFHLLEEEIGNRLLGSAAPDSGAVIDSGRQKDLLEKAVEALALVDQGLGLGVPIDAVALDVKDALDALGEITGEVTSADILNTMFGNFCVGK
jgi:tRNA modification GTPase